MSLIWKLYKEKKTFVRVGLFTYVVVRMSFGVLNTDSEFKKYILPTSTSFKNLLVGFGME